MRTSNKSTAEQSISAVENSCVSGRYPGSRLIKFNDPFIRIGRGDGSGWKGFGAISQHDLALDPLGVVPFDPFKPTDAVQFKTGLGELIDVCDGDSIGGRINSSDISGLGPINIESLALPNSKQMDCASKESPDKSHQQQNRFLESLFYLLWATGTFQLLP